MPPPSAETKFVREQAIRTFLDLYLGNGTLEDLWALADAWENAGDAAVAGLLDLLGARPSRLDADEHAVLQVLALETLERLDHGDEAAALLAQRPDALLSRTVRRWLARNASWEQLADLIRSSGDPSILLDLPRDRDPPPGWVDSLEPALRVDRHRADDPATIGLVGLRIAMGEEDAVRVARAAFLAGEWGPGDVVVPQDNEWVALIERLSPNDQAEFLDHLAGGGRDVVTEAKMRSVLVAVARRVAAGASIPAPLAAALENIAANRAAGVAASEARALLQVVGRLGTAAVHAPPLIKEELAFLIREDVLSERAVLGLLARLAAGSTERVWSELLLERLEQLGEQRYFWLPAPHQVARDPAFAALADELARLPWSSDVRQRIGREHLEIYLRTRAGTSRAKFLEQTRRPPEGPEEREWRGGMAPLDAQREGDEQIIKELVEDETVRASPRALLRLLELKGRCGQRAAELMFPTFRSLAQDYPDIEVRHRAVRLAVAAAPTEADAYSILSRQEDWMDANYMEEAWEEAVSLWRRDRLSLDLLLAHFEEVLGSNVPARTRREAVDEMEEIARYVGNEGDRAVTVWFFERIHGMAVSEDSRRKIERALEEARRK